MRYIKPSRQAGSRICHTYENFDETTQILTSLFEDTEFTKEENHSFPGFDIYTFQEYPSEEDIEMAKERLFSIGKHLSIRPMRFYPGYCCVYSTDPGNAAADWLKNRYGNLEKSEVKSSSKIVTFYKDGETTIMAVENDLEKANKGTLWFNIDAWNFVSRTFVTEMFATDKGQPNWSNQLSKEIELAMLTRIIPEWAEECYGLKKEVDYKTIGKSDEEDFENLEDL